MNDILGRYELLSILGTNVSNVIYKARDERDCLVVLKVVEPNTPDHTTALQRLMREAQAMAGCQHPGILEVYEVGEHLGRAYMVMELAEGGSLADKMNSPWSPKSAALVVAHVAHAVEACHKHGLIHRGVNARHVFFTNDANLKLGGFGLARLAPAHVYPEGSQPPTVAEDINAVGSLLYELLTTAGSKTYDSEPDSANLARLPKLLSICSKCLGKHPMQRYTRAAEVAEDLERLLAT